MKRKVKNLISSSSDEEAEQTIKNFEIRRCKCLGKYFRDRARPISVDFLQKDDTDYIMENKSHLPEGVYVSLQLHMQNQRKKWNFPLNFQTMCKLSERYSRIFQTQSSGCASGVDHFRNFTKLKILNI